MCTKLQNIRNEKYLTGSVVVHAATQTIKHDFNRGIRETHVSSITLIFVASSRLVSHSAIFDEDLWLNLFMAFAAIHQWSVFPFVNVAWWMQHIDTFETMRWHIFLRLKLIYFSHEKWWSKPFHEPLSFIQTIQFNLVSLFSFTADFANSSALTLFSAENVLIFLTIKFAHGNRDKQTI